MKIAAIEAEKKAEEIIQRLLMVLTREREYAVKLDGEALGKTVKDKAELMNKLEKKIQSIPNISNRLKRSISFLRFTNGANLRLFKSIMKLRSHYRKILVSGRLESVAYGKHGQFNRLPVSLKFVGSA